MISLNHKSGFTLIEVIFAMLILLFGLGAIAMMQTSTLSSLENTKRMSDVSQLMQNLLAETQNEIEGRLFEEIEPKKEGKFDPPFENYSYERLVELIEFPKITLTPEQNPNQPQDSGQMTMLMQKMQAYLNRSLKKLTLKIKWQEGVRKKEKELKTYWVDLTHEIDILPQAGF